MSADAVDRLASLARAAAAARTEPGTAIVAIDGRSGAGKSTLAGRLARALDAPLLSMEELYPGWDALEEGIEVLADEVLAPLAAGRAARVPRYDWAAGRWAQERVELMPPPLLVVDGVGSGARAPARYVSLLVWVELDARVRRERLLGRRDAELYGPHWDLWAEQEEAMLARERTAERADVVIEARDLEA